MAKNVDMGPPALVKNVNAGQCSQLRQTVVRIGLAQHRMSELVYWADVLENNGFDTRKSLLGLSDEAAAALNVPGRLAAALRADAQGQPSYRKSGPVLPLPEETEENLKLDRVPSGLAHISAGFLTYETNPRELGWAHRLAGFPAPLRQYGSKDKQKGKFAPASPEPLLPLTATHASSTSSQCSAEDGQPERPEKYATQKASQHRPVSPSAVRSTSKGHPATLVSAAGVRDVTAADQVRFVSKSASGIRGGREVSPTPGQDSTSPMPHQASSRRCSSPAEARRGSLMLAKDHANEGQPHQRSPSPQKAHVFLTSKSAQPNTLGLRPSARDSEASQWSQGQQTLLGYSERIRSIQVQAPLGNSGEAALSPTGVRSSSLTPPMPQHQPSSPRQGGATTSSPAVPASPPSPSMPNRVPEKHPRQIGLKRLARNSTQPHMPMEPRHSNGGLQGPASHRVSSPRAQSPSKLGGRGDKEEKGLDPLLEFLLHVKGQQDGGGGAGNGNTTDEARGESPRPGRGGTKSGGGRESPRHSTPLGQRAGLRAGVPNGTTGRARPQAVGGYPAEQDVNRLDICHAPGCELPAVADAEGGLRLCRDCLLRSAFQKEASNVPYRPRPRQQVARAG
eukprot:TRINITY_DN56861_c0_g1_i2.p1 TRINITY_DN56861_c0_g1~~TRINITY_DN56861_c0_g1_i2.p1  ORF type:complete len:621 (+),score=116.07 TRINITY_DN56861_c0_g1_i2:93-1955(+)